MSVVVGNQTHGIADFTDSKRVSVHLSVVLLCVIVYFGLSFPMWLHMVSYIYMTKMHIFVCMRLCMRWVHVRVYLRFFVWLCMVQGVPHQPHSVEWLLSMGCSETGFHIYYGMYVVLVSGIIQPTTIVEIKNGVLGPEIRAFLSKMRKWCRDFEGYWDHLSLCSNQSHRGTYDSVNEIQVFIFRNFNTFKWITFECQRWNLLWPTSTSDELRHKTLHKLSLLKFLTCC